MGAQKIQPLLTLRSCSLSEERSHYHPGRRHIDDSSSFPGLQEGAGASQMDARPGSIASTYWRPERSDRKNLLTVVDER